MLTNMLLAAMIAFSPVSNLQLTTNPPVVAQNECQTPEDVYADIVPTAEIEDQIGVISGDNAETLKDILSAVYSVERNSMIFDRVEFYSFDTDVMGEEYGSAIWVVLYMDGCFYSAFVEDAELYNSLPVELFE